MQIGHLNVCGAFVSLIFLAGRGVGLLMADSTLADLPRRSTATVAHLKIDTLTGLKVSFDLFVLYFIRAGLWLGLLCRSASPSPSRRCSQREPRNGN